MLTSGSTLAIVATFGAAMFTASAVRRRSAGTDLFLVAERSVGNPFDPHVAYTFGITVTIGLLSGPVGDQQHWQRVFSFQKGKAFRGYLIGAAVFAVVPLTMSLLGFIAAGNPEAAPAILAGDLPAQQVGPEVIRTLLPPGAWLPSW